MSLTVSSFAIAEEVTLSVAAPNAGDILSILNPFGADVLIERVIANLTTPSGGAATVDIGIANDGSTSADNVIDGLSIASAGRFDNVTDHGTNGKTSILWGAGKYLNVSKATGAGNAEVNLEGQIIITGIRVQESATGGRAGS